MLYYKLLAYKDTKKMVMNDIVGSILDRVITSKKINEIEQFNPVDVISSLTKNLTNREEDILRRRHGLLGKENETLEDIGASYKVTRERIRQIESTAIARLKKSKNFNEVIGPIENTVFSVLEQHGGVMSENSLMNELLQVSGNTSINRKNILFAISELLDNKFKLIEEDADFRRSWRLIHAPISLLKETCDSILQIIVKHNKPLGIHDVLNVFKQAKFYTDNQHSLSDESIVAFLETSQHISKNPFNEYGLTKWGSIVPKRMNDKIYLVLKRNGKPMHFTDIAKMINDTKFDERKAYPPTVHNELILNKQYVLVGRGIYALKEWGYQPGVVADVLVDILQKSEHPLSREDLVKKVLEKRIVKKNTIHLALTDKTKFKKLPDGTYTIAEQAV